ncbi:MAG: hypothetical protein WCA84_05005 [Ignavibacteriaceae bacterium]
MNNNDDFEVTIQKKLSQVSKLDGELNQISALFQDGNHDLNQQKLKQFDFVNHKKIEIKNEIHKMVRDQMYINTENKFEPIKVVANIIARGFEPKRKIEKPMTEKE